MRDTALARTRGNLAGQSQMRLRPSPRSPRLPARWLSWRDHNDVGLGMRTTTFKKETTIAFVVDDSAEELVVTPSA